MMHVSINSTKSALIYNYRYLVLTLQWVTCILFRKSHIDLSVLFKPTRTSPFWPIARTFGEVKRYCRASYGSHVLRFNSTEPAGLILLSIIAYEHANFKLLATDINPLRMMPWGIPRHNPHDASRHSRGFSDVMPQGIIFCPCLAPKCE